MPEQADTLQEQIEQLCRKGGGVVRFDYSRVYPVCLHYERRAKYLSAQVNNPDDVYRDRTLPTSAAVSAALQEAWGFNFYFPRQLLIMRFPPAFAQREVLKTLSQKSADDDYYRAWIRLGDINIIMRLRDWRPNGEVIAPLALRQQMRQESLAELKHYI